MRISALGWVSFGSAEAEAVNALMGALTDSEARDELGIGAIRDGFSDLLFPGTSTVQTRLRYFLMIPQIFHDIDLRARDRQAALRDAEVGLIARILALPEGADRDQLIGVDAGAKLKRMPSAIYWGGIGAWGIRLDDRARIRDVLERMAEGERCWVEMPSIPKDDTRGFNLTKDEADWIVDRCASLRDGQTLLGNLMSRARNISQINDLNEVAQLDLPRNLQLQLNHALAFADTLFGASLLYNLLLAERFAPDTVEQWQQQLDEWQRSEIVPAKDARTLIAPLLEASAEIAFRPNPLTMRFLNAWLGVMHAPTSKDARDIIIARERQAKPGRARLQINGDYNWSGSSGAGRLTFRWGRVHRYLQDVSEANEA